MGLDACFFTNLLRNLACYTRYSSAVLAAFCGKGGGRTDNLLFSLGAFWPNCISTPRFLFLAHFAMAPAMDAQAENPTTQVRLRTSPQAPPSPPPLPGNVEHGHAMWGFLDQQILMQVFTVLLTLLVVAVVRHITAWWNGPDKPKGAPKNVDTPSAEASDGPKKAMEETPKDDKQESPDAPAKPDKSTVVDDSGPPKTTGAPTNPPAKTQTGPGANAGGADKSPMELEPLTVKPRLQVLIQLLPQQ